MATIHVSDFTTFINAVKTADADVILDADLDANGWSPQVTNWTCQLVDGGNHTIRNIQHTVSGGYSLFRLTRNGGCTISNVKFLNLLLTPGSPWGSSFINGNNGTNTIKNCEFQGLFKTQRVLSGKIDLISQCTFAAETGSYGTIISVDGVPSSVGHDVTVVDECYFDCNSGGDNNYYTSNVIGFTYADFSVVSNCYFKGQLKVENNNQTTINGALHNCVVNIEFTPKDNTITTLKIGNPNILLSGVTLYNTSKVDESLTVNTQTDLVGLSDTDLKYPGGLTAIPPTGFPLVI